MDIHPSCKRGNNQEGWAKLLAELDEKMQLGLLDRLRRIKSYHFEESTLTIETDNPEDLSYLAKPVTHQQLELFAQEVCKVEKVKFANS